jgi:hypothetical protein
MSHSPSTPSARSRCILHIPFLLSPTMPNSPVTSHASQLSDTQVALDATQELCAQGTSSFPNFQYRSTDSTLLYLEAIRPNALDLVKLGKSGQSVRGEPSQEGRIVKAIDSEEPGTGIALESIINLGKCDNSPLPRTGAYMGSRDSLYRSSVYITDSNSTSDSCRVNAASKKHKTPSPPLAPLPRLLYPLLCLRTESVASPRLFWLLGLLPPKNPLTDAAYDMLRVYCDHDA